MQRFQNLGGALRISLKHPNRVTRSKCMFCFCMPSQSPARMLRFVYPDRQDYLLILLGACHTGREFRKS
jgi:hypothetical protein